MVRWGGRPETVLLSDYEKLLEYLFSDHHEQCVKYMQKMKQGSSYERPPETKLDSVQHIWEAVLPTRELVISGGKVQARKRGTAGLYNAREMSDGERVIFYLIGEALSVQPNGIFIVDEPELHLHRAIQSRLWDAIEAERPDCLLVYLTHDLDFAASRKGASTVWLREYSDGQWEWDLVPQTDEFSEAMLLELLGSRKPILFVEGDKGSLDYFVYGKLYPQWTIMPCGSCDHVVHATTSFTAMGHLHSNRCRGIVDARSLTNIAGLNGLGVDVLPFAEIENLFLAEPIIHLAARTLSLDETKTLEEVKKVVFANLARDRQSVVSSLAITELEGAFRAFNSRALGKSAIATEFNSVTKKIDAESVYDKWDKEIERVISSQDYAGALRYYSNKGLAASVGGIFKTPLRDLILRKLRSADAAQIVTAMQPVIPTNA